uniref:3-hydroxyacyl-CoA dehydrogenase NAD binding domain-containing protein n=1 Tax=Eptatretus burgeri TaxID=7764 RepID=A0A8C4QJM3_EPTBU
MQILFVNVYCVAPPPSGGGGIIGRSWSMLFTAAGFSVSLQDSNPEQLTRALSYIRYMKVYQLVLSVSVLSCLLIFKPSNISGVGFLENAMIVKTAIVETKRQWEEGSSVPGLRENIEEERQSPEINILQLK